MDVSLLRVENVSCRFADHFALQDINFEVPAGRVLGIIGRSGAGKTTLLRCLSGVERPSAGRIIIEGADITDLPERQLVQVRRRVGLVFQHFNLLQSRTVAGNIALPLEIANVPKRERAARVNELIDLVGLVGHERKRPSQLSGGQKQRVGIARALAANPALLLCDEATSALDPETTIAILDLLRDINRRLGLTIILITHEMDVIRRITQRVLVLDNGRIVEDGETQALLSGAAQHFVTRSFLADAQLPLSEIVTGALCETPFEGASVIVRISLETTEFGTRFLSILSRQFSFDVVILQANVGTTSGRPSKDFVIGLPRHDLEVLDVIRRNSRSMEVLGYVALDR